MTKENASSVFFSPGLLINIFGLVLYVLLLVLAFLMTPECLLPQETPGPADGLFLVLLPLPVLAFFEVFNLGWLVVILCTFRQSGLKRLGVWVLAFFSWFVVTMLVIQVTHSVYCSIHGYS